MSPVRAVALGGATVALLDGLDAVVFFGLRGVPPLRVFQAIAAGLLGRSALDGGVATAALGVGLHGAIALTIVAVYYGASRRLPGLATRPLFWGPLYGIIVYLTMNLAVIPLSALNAVAPAWPVVVNGLAIHVLGVGLPAAWFSRSGSVLAPPGFDPAR